MKNRLLLNLVIVIMFLGNAVIAHAAKEKYARTGKVTYKMIYNGKEAEGMPGLYVEYAEKTAKVWRDAPDVKELIPGYATEATYIDYQNGSIKSAATFTDGDAFYTETLFSELREVEFLDETRDIEGFSCKKAKVVINSNHIEIWYTEDAGIQGSPMPTLGKVPGLVLSVVRNGNNETIASSVSISRKKAKANLIPAEMGQRPIAMRLATSNVRKW